MTEVLDDQVALVDLDGTTANYDYAMRMALEDLRGPLEPEMESIPYGDVPEYMEARMDLIKRQPGFWKSLPPITLGLEICHVLHSRLGYQLMVVTKGPKRTTAAWTEKVEWAQTHLPQAGVTVTYDSERDRHKALVYGKILFDDYPPYIKGWLKHRPRGKVLMLDTPYNRDFEHPNVLRILQEPILSVQQETMVSMFVGPALRAA